ncbi:hypothetical protein ACQP1G_29395 [Nocardia sp. CA-107356]|uniref:hypothetical protein n=1 Tax=Nocardia sp. CA-107356 TaxID=3239972 RepID=UPI003D8D7B27
MNLGTGATGTIGRPLVRSATVEIIVSDVERAVLVRRAESPDRREAERPRIVLACAEGYAAYSATFLSTPQPSIRGGCWQDDLHAVRPSFAASLDVPATGPE